MAQEVNDLDDDRVAELNNFWDTKMSYILKSFGCEDQSFIYYNFFNVIFTVLILFLICYFVLLIKIKK